MALSIKKHALIAPATSRIHSTRGAQDPIRAAMRALSKHGGCKTQSATYNENTTTISDGVDSKQLYLAVLAPTWAAMASLTCFVSHQARLTFGLLRLLSRTFSFLVGLL